MPSSITTAAAPDDAALDRALGKARPHWDAIVAALDEAGVAHAWKGYGAKHGWQVKAVRGGKAVLYLIPGEGSFVAALALPAALVPRLEAAGIPADLARAIAAGKPAREGVPARITVRRAADVKVVRSLLALQLGGARQPARRGVRSGA